MRRLLVVERDSNALHGLVELLRDEGFQVYGVEKGLEALDVVAMQTFDIALCDYSLSDMDGLELCQQLKKRWPEMVLFLLTAYDQSRIIETAREFGVAEIFTKPIVPEDLFVILFRYSASKTSAMRRPGND